MPRKPRNTVPTSVILTHAEKALVKKFAEREQRSFSHQLRWIIQSWCEFQSKKKEIPNGKESQEAG